MSLILLRTYREKSKAMKYNTYAFFDDFYIKVFFLYVVIVVFWFQLSSCYRCICHCTQQKKRNWQVVLACIWKHCHQLLLTAARRVISQLWHTTTTVYLYILVHMLSLLIIWGSWIKVLPVFKTKSSSVPLSQAAGIKVAGSAIQKLAILRETTAGECHSSGRSSASLKRRSLRVKSACRISVSHQLAIVSVLRQLAVFQCRSR